MEEITLKKERVLKAAEACSTAKRTLEILCPEFFEEEKREDGWYKDDCCKDWMIYFENGVRKFGFDANGFWLDKELSGNGFETRDRKATPSEIEEALIKEWKKQGGNERNFKCLVCFNVTYKPGSKWFYEADTDTLWYGINTEANCCYKRGQWAEIIPSKKKMTISEIEKELGYEIEIINA